MVYSYICVHDQEKNITINFRNVEYDVLTGTIVQYYSITMIKQALALHCGRQGVSRLTKLLLLARYRRRYPKV